MIANTMKSQRGKDGGGIGPEETLVAETVRSHPRPGSNSSGNIAGPPGVRRLTPTECERLQALPDGWTQLGDTADSKRYAALGDAVTANVAEWLGGRLATTHDRACGRDQGSQVGSLVGEQSDDR